MAEGVIFVLTGSVLASIIFISLGWHRWMDPRWIVFFFFVLLIPGLWGAFTTGPFVPSGGRRFKTMLKLADLKPTDTVYELGFGSGTLLFQAAKIARKAIGYEIAIPLVIFAKLRKLLNGSKAKVLFGDIWRQDYQDADIIFCYLMPNAMKRFHKEIWPKLKPGTRLISNAFRMHDLQPIQQEGSVYVYKV